MTDEDGKEGASAYEQVSRTLIKTLTGRATASERAITSQWNVINEIRDEIRDLKVIMASRLPWWGTAIVGGGGLAIGAMAMHIISS